MLLAIAARFLSSADITGFAASDFCHLTCCDFSRRLVNRQCAYRAQIPTRKSALRQFSGSMTPTAHVGILARLWFLISQKPTRTRASSRVVTFPPVGSKLVCKLPFGGHIRQCSKKLTRTTTAFRLLEYRMITKINLVLSDGTAEPCPIGSRRMYCREWIRFLLPLPFFI